MGVIGSWSDICTPDPYIQPVDSLLKDILIKRGWHLPKTTIYWEFDSCSLFRLFLQGPQRGWGCEGAWDGGWALAHTLFERDKKCVARFDFDLISNLHGSIVSFLTKTGSMTYNSNSHWEPHTSLFYSLGQQSGAPNINFRKISVRKAIWDLEFLEHLL